MNELYIIGTSGAALEVANYIIAVGDKYNLIGFIEKDSNIDRQYLSYKGVSYPIIEESLFLNDDKYNGSMVVIAVGFPALRRKIAEKFRNKVIFPNIIDPRADILNDDVILGEGNIIGPHCIMSNNIHIGDFNYLNIGVLLGHDVIIGDFNVINARVVLSGNVKVGDECLIGSNSSCRQGISIVSGTTIGIGSTVVLPIKASGSYIGCPVSRIKY